MEEDTIIRQELDQFAATLLARGHSAGWVGLELMTLGMGMLAPAMGAQKMSQHFRRIAEEFEKSTAQIDHNGYSSIG
ncbi:MAG TPA: hypothetical protein VEW64_06685 [Methyloceanibacter sp.]|jgi:hypothetical protein|nr:hypothetical protein [Methyloceanibacter sp.]